MSTGRAVSANCGRQRGIRSAKSRAARDGFDETDVTYDCSKCPAYCCSYPVIAVTKRDVDRLAKHFAIPPEEAERKFTKSAHGHKRVMRRKADAHFGRACRFLDQTTRGCTVYEARPAVCRQFPAEKRCGYYDFLQFERRHQDDPEFVATTDNGLWK